MMLSNDESIREVVTENETESLMIEWKVITITGTWMKKVINITGT